MKEAQHHRAIDYFKWLTTIPRCSGHEEAVGNALMEWAAEHDFHAIRDNVGNILIRRPGSENTKDKTPIVLQGHMDMVCVKTPDSHHDFSCDPIPIRIEDDWIFSEETTLGADNGIAVAMGMALLEEEGDFPPLELLVTVDEEEGMSGAIALDPSWLEGKSLINIDSEEEGTFVAGCAGGQVDQLVYQKETCPRRFSSVAHLSLEGLQGGHSGMEIHRGLGNANLLLARVLDDLLEKGLVEVLHFHGGAKSNAIPRDAVATIAFDEKEDVRKSVEHWEKILSEEFSPLETDLRLYLTETTCDDDALTHELAQNMLQAMLVLPNGVYSMSHMIPELVESSSNLGTVQEKEDSFLLTATLRSSLDSKKTEISRKFAKVAHMTGAEHIAGGGYPAWEYHEESPLRHKAILLYREMFDKPPTVDVIHAGLECAHFASRLPGLDMISIGPNVLGAHAPGERVSISSTLHVYEFLKQFLTTLGE